MVECDWLADKGQESLVGMVIKTCSLSRAWMKERRINGRR